MFLTWIARSIGRRSRNCCLIVSTIANKPLMSALVPVRMARGAVIDTRLAEHAKLGSGCRVVG